MTKKARSLHPNGNRALRKRPSGRTTKAQSFKSSIELWAERIGWKHRVRAVCKPCWELKYCPYGPVVEDFPLRENRDERSCRIFGHDCPVFYVAEPFTETREVRNVSRQIPRPVQFRVLKRENQVCRDCGKPVGDDDIHFDHIIPYSKGGSSDEHNVRLLCGPCNLRKGAKFEETHLIHGSQDHMIPPLDDGMMRFLLMMASFARDFRLEENRAPTARDIARNLASGKLTEAERFWEGILLDLESFFGGPRPAELKPKLFRALADRWGFGGNDVTSLKAVAADLETNLDDLFDADISLVRRLGLRVDVTSRLRREWVDLEPLA